MSITLAAVTFDCEDAAATAGFWSAALGRPIDPDPSEFFASTSPTPTDRTSLTPVVCQGPLHRIEPLP